jgi:uncharacterized membrane protein
VKRLWIAIKGPRLRGHASLVLALLYVLLALPLSIAFCFQTTMMDVPDEGNHLLRATQLGQGGFFGVRYPGNVVGGEIPSTAVQATNFVNIYLYHPGVPISRETRARYRALGWPSRPERAQFPNTAIYPPWFYAASAVAIDAGRLLDLKIMESFRIARIADAVAATLIGALAIGLAETGVPILVVLLALPMTLYLFGSASQDALMIACAALEAAILTRQMRGRAVSWRGWMLSGGLLGLIGAARAPYLILSLIPALIAWPRADRSRGLAATIVAVAISVFWLAGSVLPLSVPTRAGGGLLTGAQMHWVLHHPAETVTVLARSVVLTWPEMSRQFIGLLGWLDIRLPERIYRICEWVVLATLLASLAWQQLLGPRQLAIGALLLTVAAATEAAIFLSWSPLGADLVTGVQGRYFIPLSMFLCLLGRRPGAAAIAIGVIALLIILSTGNLAALQAVAERYPQ